jgi:hypothetical protein
MIILLMILGILNLVWRVSGLRSIQVLANASLVLQAIYKKNQPD